MLLSISFQEAIKWPISDINIHNISNGDYKLGS